MSGWKAIKNIEKVQPECFEASGHHKALYYEPHYEEGTSDEEDFADDDEPVISKEEFLRDLDSALHDLKLSMEGKLKFRPIEDLFDELARDDDEEKLKAIAQ